MKKVIFILSAAVIITAAACNGNNKANGNSADSGQEHVGNTGPADSAKISTTPNETGGKDTSGNGSGNTNAPKDTLKTNP